MCGRCAAVPATYAGGHAQKAGVGGRAVLVLVAHGPGVGLTDINRVDDAVLAAVLQDIAGRTRGLELRGQRLGVLLLIEHAQLYAIQRQRVDADFLGDKAGGRGGGATRRGSDTGGRSGRGGVGIVRPRLCRGRCRPQ